MLRKNSLALSAAAGLATCFAFASHADATVLTFDGSFWNDGRAASDAYGSNVTGNTGSFIYGPECDITPDVITDYVGTMRWKETGYGDLTGFLHADHPQSAVQRFLTIVLANTSPGGTVSLHSFDLASESDEALRIDWIRVYANNMIVYEDLEPVIPNLGRMSIMFNPPVMGTVIQIELNMTRLSFKSEQIGIDNIKFGQPGIPTPGAGSLLAVAAGLLAVRRRR